MHKYTVQFDRIGRDRNPSTATIHAADDVDLAEKLLRHVRPKLRSRDVDIFLADDGKSGGIACGFHSGGSFTVSSEKAE